MCITKNDMIPNKYDAAVIITRITQWITRTDMMSPFPTIALTYSKTFLEILFFPIYFFRAFCLKIWLLLREKGLFCEGYVYNKIFSFSMPRLFHNLLIVSSITFKESSCFVTITRKCSKHSTFEALKKLWNC